MATRKLTISIPEELANRLEPWRDHMNISGVCTAAVQDRVISLEHRNQDYRRRPDSVKGFALLIEELRFLQIGEAQMDYIQGYDDGGDYAREQAKREDFERYERLEPSDIIREGILPKPAHERLGLLVREADVEDQTIYEIGWLTAMAEAWGRIKSGDDPAQARFAETDSPLRKED